MSGTPAIRFSGTTLDPFGGGCVLHCISQNPGSSASVCIDMTGSDSASLQYLRVRGGIDEASAPAVAILMARLAPPREVARRRRAASASIATAVIFITTMEPRVTT